MEKNPPTNAFKLPSACERQNGVDEGKKFFEFNSTVKSEGGKHFHEDESGLKAQTCNYSR